MNVTVSVFGRFHAFNLAVELARRGHLRRLITSYPRGEVVRYGVPGPLITTLPALEVLKRGWSKSMAWLGLGRHEPAFVREAFDHAAARRIPGDTDLYVGWSGFSERGLGRARAIGAKAVVERGSTHIEVQRDLLREEVERTGLHSELPSSALVEKELREYDAADFIVVPSEFARRSFLAKGFPAAKILKTAYGVDLSQFRVGPRSESTFRIIYVGTMSVRKGVHYLLEAFAGLRLPRAELWLVGPRTRELDSYFHRYASTYRYFRQVPQAELVQYYAQSSVFAICSIEEGMAMVQAQAMACGLPLVCTPNTGGEDLITSGREGLLVPVRDVPALQEALLLLYKEPERCREMGRAARARVEAGFSWSDYGDRVMSAYAQILPGALRRAS